MTKLELPKLFKHYHEIEGRDGFNPSCGVTLDNFQSLIGEYHFSEEVRCQVRKSDGNCGNNHLHGWLGLTKEGKEGLIGWLCAVKYFNADKTFAIERNRVRKEISISSSLASLNNLLTNRDVFEQTIETQMSRIRFLRDSVKSLESRLLPSVIKTVSDMEKLETGQYIFKFNMSKLMKKVRRILNGLINESGIFRAHQYGCTLT